MSGSDGSFSIGSLVWPGTSKLIEEMGELTQVLGKLIAIHGAVDHWDGTDLAERLVEEIGDVLAAINFFTAHNEIPTKDVYARASRKLDLFCEWHLEHLANVPGGAS